MNLHKKLKKFIENAIEEEVFPGVVLLISFKGEIIYHEAFGYSQKIPEKRFMEKETVFDIASLTKPIATATSIMKLVENGKLSLDSKVIEIIPLNTKNSEKITIRDLLSHSSGLPSWKPYYEEIIKEIGYSEDNFNFSYAKSLIYNKIHNENLVYFPKENSLYSDLGFILLCELVEKISKKNFDEFCATEIFEPLNLKNTFYNNFIKKDKKVLNYQFASTENCPWRKKILTGEVHDDNTYIMGGVSGHAGLFSTASDISIFINEIISSYYGKSQFISKEIAVTFFSKANPFSTWALGWDTPSFTNSSSGKYFSKTSIGHLGFTGVSMWVDLEKILFIILLTNRVHPTRNNDKIKKVRPIIHDIIMEEIIK